ncbi:MAG: serine hydrolase [Candidatus Omnitrophota bacterium]|nr:MAG: serine hydrolase [Candidatus Omnitrophota bacterium]
MMRKRIPHILGLLFLFFLSIVIASAYPKLSSINRRKEEYSVLGKKINIEAKRLQADLSFVIKDLSHPEFHLFFNEDKEFPAASLIKLPIVAVVFKAVGEDKLQLDKKIRINKKDIENGSGIIKKMKMPVELTIEDLLSFMIAISDNTATNKVINLLGYDYINESFKELGLNNTVLKRKMMDFHSRRKGIENYTSANDIAFLLEKIYNRSLVDSKASKQMLALLQKQKVKDRIPRALPKNIVIAHKTGLEKKVVHDAGIVFSSKGDYIICVLTKEVKNDKKAKEFISQLSLSTYKLYQ